MKGQIADRPFGEILAELSRTNASGILNATQDKITKAIFFEEGQPVLALSNSHEDQLGDALVRDCLITSEQLAQFGGTSNIQQLSQKLVENGLVSSGEIERAIQRLSTNAILSIFEWQTGEFTFEKKDRARINMNGKLLDAGLSIIVTGTRKSITDKALKTFFPNPDRHIKPSANAQEMITKVQLDGNEGLLLSRVIEPMPIQQAISLSGLPENDAWKALFTLCVSGILEQTGAGAAKPIIPISPPKAAVPPATGAKPEEKTMDEEELKFQQDVMRMLAFFASADYYEILGVTRRVNEGDIKKAYYQLAKKYHPDRAHKTSSPELKNGLDKVFTKITEAYEKLKDPDERKRYDEKIRGKQERPSGPTSLPKQSPPRPATPPPTPASVPVVTPPVSAPTPPRPSTPVASNPTPTPVAPTPPRPAPAPTPVFTPAPTPPRPTPPPAATPISSPAAAAARPAPAAGVATPVAGSAVGTPAAGPAPGQPSRASAPAGASTQANKNNPDMAEIYLNQAKQAMAQQDIARAAFLLREAVNIAPDNKAYRQQLVQVLVRNQKWHKEAEEHLNKLLEQDSVDANSHALLGIIYKAGGDIKRAISKFQEALSLDDKNKIAKRELKTLKEEGLLGGGKGGGSAAGIMGMWQGLSTPLKAAVVIVGMVILYFVYSSLFGAPPPAPPPTPKPSAKPGLIINISHKSLTL